MRVNINLASRKYEDVQQFFLRWGVALAFLAALTLLLGAALSLNIKNGQRERAFFYFRFRLTLATWP